MRMKQAEISTNLRHCRLPSEIYAIAGRPSGIRAGLPRAALSRSLQQRHPSSVDPVGGVGARSRQGGVPEPGAQLGIGCQPVQRFGERSEEHTSELQSLMRISYAVFCLKKKTSTKHNQQPE